MRSELLAIGRLLGTLTCHTNKVRSVAFAPDGRSLISGSFDLTLRLWELATLKERCQFRVHSGGVRSVALNADGRLLASGGVDRTVRLWDTRRGELLVTLQGHSGPVWSVALSASGATTSVCTAFRNTAAASACTAHRR